MSNFTFKEIQNITINTSEGERGLIHASITWGVDKVPTCAFMPVMGFKIMPVKDSSDLQPIPTNTGETSEIKINNKSVFKGYVTSKQTNLSLGGFIQTGRDIETYSMAGELAILDSFSFSNVVFRTPDTPITGYSSENTKASYDATSNRNYIPKDLNMSKYIIDVSEDRVHYGQQLAKGESSSVKKLLQGTGAVIRQELVGKALGLKLRISKYVSGKMVSVWTKLPPLKAIQDMAKSLFVHIVPTDDNKYTIKPLLPLAKDNEEELVSADILKINQTEKGVLQVIDRVHVPYVMVNTADATRGPTSIARLRRGSTVQVHAYPPYSDKDKGGTIILRNMPWIFTHAHCNKIAQTGTVGKKEKINTDKSKPIPKPENIVKNDSKDEMTQEQANKMGELVAQMFYAEEAFKTATMKVDVNWFDYEKYRENLGKVYKVTIKEEAKNIVYGCLWSVTLTIDSQSAKATCSLLFTYVRDEATNNKRGLTEHPVYSNWKG